MIPIYQNVTRFTSMPVSSIVSSPKPLASQLSNFIQGFVPEKQMTHTRVLFQIGGQRLLCRLFPKLLKASYLGWPWRGSEPYWFLSPKC